MRDFNTKSSTLRSAFFSTHRLPVAAESRSALGTAPPKCCCGVGGCGSGAPAAEGSSFSAELLRRKSEDIGKESERAREREGGELALKRERSVVKSDDSRGVFFFCRPCFPTLAHHLFRPLLSFARGSQNESALSLTHARANRPLCAPFDRGERNRINEKERLATFRPSIAMPPRSLPPPLPLLFLLLLSASTLASAGGNFTWSLCSPEPPFQAGVFNVTLTPPQPVAGQTAILAVSASTDAVPAVGASKDDFGFASASVSFHGLPIYSLSRPLCAVAAAATSASEDGGEGGDSSSCPFSGPYELSWEQDFPALTPAGRYRLRLRAREAQPGGKQLSPSPSSRRGGSYGAAGPEILCIDVAFNVVRPASS